MNVSSYCDPNSTRHVQLVVDWCQRVHGNTSEAAVQDCFIQRCYFPKRILPDYGLMVGMTVIYFVIMAVGAMGNVSTVVVMACDQSMRRRSTNNYLLNLAVADLVTLLVGLPFDMLTMWQQYPWQLGSIMCHLKGFITEFTSYVSVLTILMFSIERYMAVCHCFRFMCLSDQTHISVTLGCLWLIAALCSLPFGYGHEARITVGTWPLGSGGLERSRMCLMPIVFEPQLFNHFYWLFHVSALGFFVLPLCALTAAYVSIALTISRSYRFSRDRPGRRSSSRNPSAQSDLTNSRVNMMLGLVVLVFFACYAPFQLQRLMFFHLDALTLHRLHQYLYPLSGILFYSSCFLNPLVYNLMSRRYRKAFWFVLHCRCATADAQLQQASSLPSSRKYSHLVRWFDRSTQLQTRSTQRKHVRIRIEAGQQQQKTAPNIIPPKTAPLDRRLFKQSVTSKISRKSKSADRSAVLRRGMSSGNLEAGKSIYHARRSQLKREKSFTVMGSIEPSLEMLTRQNKHI